MKRLFPSIVTMSLVGALCPQLSAQSILDKDLEVFAALRPFDDLLRNQLADWLDARDAALSPDGKQTPEWWKVDDETNPVTAHGAGLLKYANDHPGTRESLVCLAYIVDWGEGEPRPLFLSACDELITHHRNNPALSWLCSRCTRPLRYDEMRSFLTRLRTASTNADVRAAASFQLAKLLDASIQMHSRISEIRDTFAMAGALEAHPDISRRLEVLTKVNPKELAAERDGLLKLVADENGRPWAAKRTFGRLNYEFQEDPEAQTFQELAEGLSYEIGSLRVGCIAPEFRGTFANGEPFRLRERRGSPTLLMFSFKGCAACEAMYPTLRVVQERFSRSGFSVIGVMVDQELDTVTAAQESGVISWPCVWDGPSGPIAETFRVSGYPTVVLLDGDGRIAATGLRDEKHLVAHIEDVLR